MGFDHDIIDINDQPEDTNLEATPMEIEDTAPAFPLPPPPPSISSPKLAGYRTFILGLAPFILAITALIILAATKPDLITVENLLIIIGLGSTGPGAATLARSFDKRTALQRLGRT